MVSLGAALFAVVSLHGFGSTDDPARVAAQIVTVIGFLGAGAGVSLATVVLVFLLLRFVPRPGRKTSDCEAK